jgi:hypothetical protein
MSNNLYKLHISSVHIYVLPAAPPSTALLIAFLRILAMYVYIQLCYVIIYKNGDSDDGDGDDDEWTDNKEYNTGPYCIVPMSTFIATATAADDEEDKIILLSTIDTNEE